MEESKETMFVTYASSLGGATAASASAVFSVSKFLGATEAAAAPLARAAAGAWASGRRTRGPRRRRPRSRCPSIRRRPRGRRPRRGRRRRRRRRVVPPPRPRAPPPRGDAASRRSSRPARAGHAASAFSAAKKPAPFSRTPRAAWRHRGRGVAGRRGALGIGRRRRGRRRGRNSAGSASRRGAARRSSLKLISTASVVLSSCSICGGSIICSRCPAAQRLLRLGTRGSY